jgi:hypothetical protein
VEVPSDGEDCGVLGRLYIPIIEINSPGRISYRPKFFPIPEKMDWEWISEMKEFVRLTTEIGNEIDYKSFIQNIIRPNLRKLHFDCKIKEDEIHNEFYFGVKIFGEANQL